MNNLNSAPVAKAISWICTAQSNCKSGGVPATYRPLLGWSNPYPETTGYIIPTFLELSISLERPELRQRALTMGEWLLSIQNEDGSFPGGTWSEDSNNAPSVFNSGQILFGLCSLWQHEKDDKWRRAGERCASWLAQVQESNGSWINFAYRNTLHTYKTRVAWPIAIASTLWGLDEVEVAARKNLDHALSKHQPSGWIENTSFNEDTPPVLHTFAYTVQGMLESGILLKDQKYIDAAINSAAALLHIQSNDGSLPGAVDQQFSNNWYRCLTGIAQMAIIWGRLSEIGDKSEDWHKAGLSALRYLEKNQSNFPSNGLRGAFAGSKPAFGPYMRFRYPNWAVKFYLDAAITLEKGMGDHAWG